MKKKLVVISISMVLAMSLMACGGGSSDKKKSSDTTQSVNKGETSEDDNSEEDKGDGNVKLSEWGETWVDPQKTRIAINFPERSVTDGGGQMGYYNSGMATLVMRDYENAPKTDDVTKIFSVYEDYWKEYMPSAVQINEIEKLEIESEETVEINGYTFYKLKGKFHFNGYYDKKYTEDVIGYATFTKYGDHLPVYFFVWDGAKAISTSDKVIESVADRIEETADNMAKSLCEYEGGDDAYSNYVLYGLESLKFH